MLTRAIIAETKTEAETNTVSPNLILNQNKTNFYDITIDDFTMENYEPTKPQLKLELGI